MARRRAKGTGTLVQPRPAADFWCRTLRASGSGYVFMNLKTSDRQEALALLDSDVVQAALRKERMKD